MAISGYLPIILTDMAKFYAAKTTDKCHVTIGAIKMLPATFTSSFISISVFLQAILFIFTSSIADYGSLRKKMLLSSGFIGAILTCAFILLFDVKLYIIAGVLLILTNILFGYTKVFLNAYLPYLVRSLPESLQAKHDDDAYTVAIDNLSNKHSVRSLIISYASGVISLIISVPIVLFLKGEKKPWYDCSKDTPKQLEDNDSLLGLRISVLISGIIWIIGSVISALWLKKRPGPPLPKGKNYLSVSLSNIIGTFKKIKRLRYTFIFLLSFFIYSDSYNTIASVGILFAKSDLNADSSHLIIMLIEAPLVALIGNFFWLWFKERFKFSTKSMIIINLCFLSILPIYGFIGFIPNIKFGLKNIWELYLFAAIYGFNLGSIQSFSRSLFILLTPPKKEAEFFGFYALTDKGSAWIGPAIVAVLTESTGQVRYGFIFLFITLVIPCIILYYFTNVPKGIEDAKNFTSNMDSVPLSQFELHSDDINILEKDDQKSVELED